MKSRQLAALSLPSAAHSRVRWRIFAADHARTADYDYDAPAPGSYTLPVVKPAADGALLDSRGQPLRLRELTPAASR